MAFLSSSRTLGEWVGVHFDKDRNVQVLFRLRKMDDDAAQDLEKALGKFVKDPSTGVKIRVVPVKKRRQYGFRALCFIWTGTKNCWIRLENQKDVEFYSKHLGRSDLKVGAEVCVDGPADQDHPPPEIKRAILKMSTVTMNQIRQYGLGSEAIDEVEEGDEDAGEDSEDDDEAGDGAADYPEDEREDDLKKTSSAPSSSRQPSLTSGSV
jgi:hypothetical protein